MNMALEIAQKVLNDTQKLMTISDIYEYAKEYYSEDVKQTFSGKTPEKSLGAPLYTDVKRVDSVFISKENGSKAKLFGLKELQYDFTDDIDAIDDNDELENEYDNENNDNCKKWNEGTLHRYLVSFMYDKYLCHCKTINANCDSTKNKKKHKHTWLHADIFGVVFFKESFDPITMNLLKNNNEVRFDLYAFEMKQEIVMAELNEEYFEAASNSSWANYGYIVAKDIDTGNTDLMEKLERYNRIFGIGVIKLDVKAYSDSRIILEAKRNEIDYSFIDDLIHLENANINDFFNEVNLICNEERTNIPLENFDKPFDSDVEGEKFAIDMGML